MPSTIAVEHRQVILEFRILDILIYIPISKRYSANKVYLKVLNVTQIISHE